jgi:hypothetical protein
MKYAMVDATIVRSTATDIREVRQPEFAVLFCDGGGMARHSEFYTIEFAI